MVFNRWSTLEWLLTHLLIVSRVWLLREPSYLWYRWKSEPKLDKNCFNYSHFKIYFQNKCLFSRYLNRIFEWILKIDESRIILVKSCSDYLSLKVCWRQSLSKKRIHPSSNSIRLKDDFRCLGLIKRTWAVSNNRLDWFVGWYDDSFR